MRQNKLNFSSTTALLALVTLFMISCAEGDTNECYSSDAIETARQAYTADQEINKATQFIAKLQEAALKSCVDNATAESMLEEGMTAAKAANSTPLEMSLLYTYVRRFGSSKKPERMLTLSQILKNANKAEASNMLLYGYSQAPVTDEQKQEALKLMSEPIESPDAYLDTLRNNTFKTTENFGIDTKKARSYIDACEAYAMAFPDNEQAPVHLFNAGEVAKSIRSFNKSFTIFDWIRDRYPNHEKAPTALFLKGFIIENEVKNDQLASEIYNQFLAEYPNHDLADDVNFLIDNLGKTDAEILEAIQSKGGQ